MGHRDHEVLLASLCGRPLPLPRRVDRRRGPALPRRDSVLRAADRLCRGVDLVRGPRSRSRHHDLLLGRWVHRLPRRARADRHGHPRGATPLGPVAPRRVRRRLGRGAAPQRTRESDDGRRRRPRDDPRRRRTPGSRVGELGGAHADGRRQRADRAYPHAARSPWRRRGPRRRRGARDRRPADRDRPEPPAGRADPAVCPRPDRAGGCDGRADRRARPGDVRAALSGRHRAHRLRARGGRRAAADRRRRGRCGQLPLRRRGGDDPRRRGGGATRSRRRRPGARARAALRPGARVEAGTRPDPPRVPGVPLRRPGGGHAGDLPRGAHRVRRGLRDALARAPRSARARAGRTRRPTSSHRD